ncbi:MAG: chemotaxis-specific protein-glutamate methyltransferase CheB [Eubacterium sp.]|nr:chemotaxis-specific protein-glutamate methyltransferase CheB [Eubacterium sp.]
MKKILIIDDSALMRRVLSDIINADSQLTVADTACNGQQALDLLQAGNTYDVAVCDIKMPKVDGVEFLRRMNKGGYKLPVLICSSIASKSANETIEALNLGAFDFVKKPSGTIGSVFREFEESVISRLHLACNLEDRDILFKETENKPLKKIEKPTISRMDTKVPGIKDVPENHVAHGVKRGDSLLVIASSTGGPKALQSVVPLLPADFPYPIVLVQHMPKGFTESLANRLDEISLVKVKEAADGDCLEKGVVYVAKGGKQCELVQNKAGKYSLSINDKAPRGGLRPCADIFFESLVNTSFEKIYCIVLTGMGADASEGIRLVKDVKKVEVVVQDKETCVVYGMPKAVEALGLADEIVPLESVTKTMLKKIGV